MKPQHRTRRVLDSGSALKPNQRLVLIAMADHCDDNLVTWVGADRLAAETGLHRTTLIAVRKQLIRDGYVEQRMGAQGKAAVYRLHLDRLPWREDEPVAPDDWTGGDARPVAEDDRSPLATRTGSAERPGPVAEDVQTGSAALPDPVRSGQGTGQGSAQRASASATPPDDLVAYLGLELQAHANALVRAGVLDRRALLRLTEEDLRYTPGLGGTRAKAISARVASWGDALPPAEVAPGRVIPLRSAPGAIPISVPCADPADEDLVRRAALRCLDGHDVDEAELQRTAAALRRQLVTSGRGALEAILVEEDVLPRGDQAFVDLAMEGP